LPADASRHYASSLSPSFIDAEMTGLRRMIFFGHYAEFSLRAEARHYFLPPPLSTPLRCALPPPLLMPPLILQITDAAAAAIFRFADYQILPRY